jgi:hypothetical protein
VFPAADKLNLESRVIPATLITGQAPLPTASRELNAGDPVRHDAVLAWLQRDWPFDTIRYAPRT